MASNIILLSDGTGNSAGSPNKTNVWRLYRALDLNNEHPGEKQIVKYDDGVGTSQFRPLALLGEAFGFGLAQNVRDLYAFLSRNYKATEYETDDDRPRIFAFGFSRGAYTIRLVVDLVSNQGLVDSRLPENEFRRQVLCRWDAYWRAFVWSRFKRSAVLTPEQREKHWDVLRQHWARLERDNRPVPKFEFVGLWDTVGAYGLPFEELQTLLPLAKLPDRLLSPIVKCAYHALALDDERRSFHPILWDEGGSKESERIQQVWFAGMHANVGGGYPKDGLAYVTLQWIVRKAASLGLKFNQTHLEEIDNQANCHDHLYNSRAGIAGYYRYSPRPVSTFCDDPVNGVKIDRAKLHESVLRRISGGRVAYGPIGIPPDCDLVLMKDRTAVRVGNGTIRIRVPRDDGSVAETEGTIRLEDDRAEITATGSGTGPAGEGPDKDGLKSVEAYLNTDGRFLQDYYVRRDKVQQRADRMQVAWDIALWRRIAYYLTLISSLFLLSMPWLAGQWSVGSFQFTLSTRDSLPQLTSSLSTYLKPVFVGAGYLVPDWVGQTWFGPSGAFRQEPVLFLIGAVGAIAMMLIGVWLDRTIHSRASDIWHDKAQAWQEREKLARAATSTHLFNLRDAPWTKTIYRWYRAFVAQVIVLLVVVGGGIAWLWVYHFDYLEVYGILLVVLGVLYWAWRRYRLRPASTPAPAAGSGT